MPLTLPYIVEKHSSRRGTIGPEGALELLYAVVGTEDDVVVRALVWATIPATYEDLVFQAYDIDPLGGGIWDVSARYGKRSPLQSLDPAGNPTGTMPGGGSGGGGGGNVQSPFAITITTKGGTQHVTQSIATINSYAPVGQQAPDFKGAIGVTADNVEGVDIVVPTMSIDVRVRLARVGLGWGRIAALYALAGKTNDRIWFGMARGTLLFLGANIEDRGSEDPDGTFSFLAAPHVRNKVIGNITGISKDAHDYLWVRYEDAVDAAANAIVKRPRAVYVERVYDEADFRLLGIGG